MFAKGVDCESGALASPLPPTDSQKTQSVTAALPTTGLCAQVWTRAVETGQTPRSARGHEESSVSPLSSVS